MTTKHRIIGGFALLIVLLALMAFLGFRSLQNASSNFEDYRRLANINVYASDLIAAVNEIDYYTMLYIQERDKKHMERAQSVADRSLVMLDEIGQRIQRADSREILKKSEALVAEMKRQMAQVRANLEQIDAMYNGSIAPNMAQADKMIAATGPGARANGNLESLYYQTILWQKLAKANALLTQVVKEIDVEAGREVLAAFSEVEKAMQDAGKSMTSERGRRDYAEMQAAFQSVMETVRPVAELSGKTRASMDSLEVLGNDMLEQAVKLNQISDDAMRANGTATLASNQSAQIALLATSSGGFLLGVLFAVFTIIALVRTLGKMATFAGDIASGNFTSEVNITEKGEIGDMFAAMRRIPAIFGSVITRCNNIAGEISSGLFRTRLDAEKLSGGFRDLANGVNTMADSYTRAIDNLPVGIISLNKDRKTVFSNESGQKMAGSDAAGAFGGKLPFLDDSLRDGGVHSAESRLTSPQGNQIDVAATALPLKNLQDELAGGLLVLTDISEIKEKQKIMLQVAGDASDVSDRVAAAAEELAAQVEEISRGADMQRNRMESTASAMTEMNSTVIEVARNAGQAASQTDNTKSSAESGAGLVRQVVSAINDVNVIGNKLHDNMQELGEKAENIGGVMGVISDIADQTNLLALNAAIEAARAGEAGRGFAVVADEVRKLAEKTMAATQEVGGTIEAIQESARTNIQEVSQAVESMGKATELANASGSALEEIVNLAASSSDVVSSIATAAEEQSATSEEINSSIEEISRITDETASGMVQSSQAVQELSRMAQELRSIMQNLH